MSGIKRVNLCLIIFLFLLFSCSKADRLYFLYTFSYDEKKFEKAINELDDVNIRFSIYDNDKTPLMASSERGQVSIVMLLLNKGAKINLRDNWQRTALDYANKSYFHNDENIVSIRKILIDAGGESGLGLLNAVRNNDLNKVIYYIEKKYEDVNARYEYNKTLLMFACENNTYEIADYLLKNNADVAFTDDDNKNALDYSYGKNRFINLIKSYGGYSIVESIIEDNYKMTEIIIKKGININDTYNIKIHNDLYDRYTALKYYDKYNKITPLEFACALD